jgi:signal transduction histidine kinase
VALTVVVADAAVVRVEDTGHGIPDAVRAHLGEPFATGRPGVGMGLGVYLARTFAELWGGRLTLEPRPGGGTVATLILPEAARG